MENSYINLSRKYRPQTVLELIGQKALVKSLENAFQLNKISHAFMLTGVRGVGKTTTARIIAKALNCTGIDGKGSITLNPCGVCENCQMILQDRHLDVIEMDAASKTGIDDIREIIENGQYKPSIARYKVFIIDEVHMLSKNAFNALLKTLEEPPPHLKFIFATTELKKIPITVLSRCQRYDLKMVEGDELTNHLIKICNLEKIEFTLEAIQLIAKAAQGSVRDSLSLLDRAIIYTNSNIQLAAILEMLGYNNNQLLYDLFVGILNNNATEVFSIFNTQKQGGIAAEIFLEEMLTICHNCMLFYHTKDNTILSLPASEIEKVTKIISLTDYSTLLQIWQIFITAIAQLKYSNNGYQICSISLLNALTVGNLVSIDELLSLNALESTSSLELTSNPNTKIIAPVNVAPVNATPVSIAAEIITNTTPDTLNIATSPPHPQPLSNTADNIEEEILKTFPEARKL